MNKASLSSLSQSAEKRGLKQSIVVSTGIGVNNGRKDNGYNDYYVMKAAQGNSSGRGSTSKTPVKASSRKKGIIPHYVGSAYKTTNNTQMNVYRSRNGNEVGGISKGKGKVNGSSDVITELTYRLNNLGEQLNMYQNKANLVKESIIKSMSPMKNKGNSIGIDITKGTYSNRPPSGNQRVLNTIPVQPNDNTDDNVLDDEAYTELLLYKGKNYTNTNSNNTNEGFATHTLNHNKHNTALLSNLQSQIKALKSFTHQTKEDLLHIKSEYTSLLSQTQTDLITAIHNNTTPLISQLSKMKDYIHQQANQSTSMQKELSILTQTNSDLNQSIAQLNQQKKDLELLLKSTKDQYEQNHLMHLLELKQLETQMNQQKEEVNDLIANYQRDKDELSHYIALNAELTKEIEDKANMVLASKTQLNTLSQQIKAKDKSIESLTKTIEILNKTIADSEVKYKTKHSEVMQMEKELKQLKSKVDNDNSNTHSDKAEIKRLNDLIAEYKNESEESINEHILLNEEIEILKMELKRERLKAEDNSKKSNERLVSLEHRHQLDKEAIIEEMTQKCNHSLNELKAEYEAKMNQCYKDIEMYKTTTMTSQSSLEYQLKTDKETICSLNSKLNSVTNELYNNTVIVKGLNETIESMQLTINNLTNEKTTLVNDIEGLKSHSDQIEICNKTLMESIESKEKDIVQYKSQLESMVNEINGIKAKLVIANNTIDNKESELKQCIDNESKYKEQIVLLTNAKCNSNSNNNTVKEISEIDKVLTILIDEDTSIEERNRIKQFLLNHIHYGSHNGVDDNDIKDNGVDHKENEEDYIYELDDDNEDIEDINKTPGQRNSTLKKRGFSTALLK